MVPVKTEEQQAVLALHTQREALIGERTRGVNGVRALFAEFGIIAPQGIANIATLHGELEKLPGHAKVAAESIFRQIENADREIKVIKIRTYDLSQNRRDKPQPGNHSDGRSPAGHSCGGTVSDPSQFKRGRNFAAWLGIVSKQNSSGGKHRLGRITKAGNPQIRRLLFLGALSTVHRAKPGTWLGELKARKPYKVTAIALANKTARMIWAVMSRGEV